MPFHSSAILLLSKVSRESERAEKDCDAEGHNIATERISVNSKEKGNCTVAYNHLRLSREEPLWMGEPGDFKDCRDWLYVNLT